MKDTENPSYPLIPELVPRPLWRKSVYRTIPKGQWNKIRQALLADARGQCQICGAANDKGMTCHEVWFYDDIEHKATLVEFKIICRECNFAHHFGMAQKEGLEHVAIQQISTVNGISWSEAQKLMDVALAKWKLRNGNEWITSVAPELIERFPVLSGFVP